MMLPSHLLATLALAFLAARFVPWDSRAWLLAIAFGVLIDIDHLFKLPQYLVSEVAAKGVAAFHPTAMLQYGAAWQGVFHHPVWAPLIVLAACLLLRTPIPAAFWGLHMVLDFVVARKYVVFGSATEWAIIAGLAVVVAVLAWAHHKSFGEGQPFGLWARGSVAGFLGTVAGLVPRR